jgi:iron complex transport system permease protein
VRRLAVATAGASLVLVASVVLAASVGTESVSLSKVWNEPESLDRTLVVAARLPRIALAALAGGGLSVVGAAFQALLRNSLADPYILGVSGGAALGATLAIALGATAVSTLGLSLLPLAAFLGGIASTVLVYAIARRGGSPSGTSILLAGVIVNALASALITLLKTLVSASRAQELLFWLTGFLDVPTPRSLLVIAVYVVVGSLFLIRESGRMNLLALGEASATHLGVDLQGMEKRVFFACSAIVGAIVSVTGLIGFVGLCVPHIVRRVAGPDHRVLLPLSFVVGASSLVLCDAAARLSFRLLGTEPPVGAVTALVGGPVFLWLLSRGGRFGIS